MKRLDPDFLLDELHDVNAPTPIEGDVLTWDGGQGHWGPDVTDTLFLGEWKWQPGDVTIDSDTSTVVPGSGGTFTKHRDQTILLLVGYASCRSSAPSTWGYGLNLPGYGVTGCGRTFFNVANQTRQIGLGLRQSAVDAGVHTFTFEAKRYSGTGVWSTSVAEHMHCFQLWESNG